MRGFVRQSFLHPGHVSRRLLRFSVAIPRYDDCLHTLVVWCWTVTCRTVGYFWEHLARQWDRFVYATAVGFLKLRAHLFTLSSLTSAPIVTTIIIRANFACLLRSVSKAINFDRVWRRGDRNKSVSRQWPGVWPVNSISWPSVAGPVPERSTVRPPWSPK